MELDLRKNGQMTIDQAKEITIYEVEVRKEYTEYIGKLVKENKVFGLDWLLRVTCRNTHLSLIHDRFCRLRLLERLLERGECITKILVDSNSLKDVCSRIIQRQGSDAVIEVSGNARIGRLYIIYNLIKTIYLSFNLFIWPRIISGKQVPDEPVIYLDSFLFIDSFENSGRLKDRYYPGLIENLSEDRVKRVWYAPTLIGIKSLKQYFLVFKSLRLSPQKFIIKEDWLKLSDYFMAIYYSYKLPKKINKIPLWDGKVVDEIVMEEVKIDKGSPALFSAILNYMFFKRLKEKKIELEVIIDWNENQVIDRSINLAAKKYYPDVIVKGYQGYVAPDYYACKDPSLYEINSKTVPDEICVIGKAFSKDKEKHCVNINVSIAPAFRFSEIHNPVYSICRKRQEILIVLPISLQESMEIITMCNRLAKTLLGRYDFIIKQHPSYTKKRFLELFPELSSLAFNFSDKTLYENLSRCRMLISASSSVCLEAAVLGVPVAIVGSLSGPAMNPLVFFDELPWRICYAADDIVDFLSNKSSERKKGIDYYFEPITPEGVEKFLSGTLK